MKDKLTRFEILYYVLSIYCLWASQELFAVTVQAQGTEDVSVLNPALIVLGAIAPITTMTSSLPLSGSIVGVFILISPLMGAIFYKDLNKKWFGVSCWVLTGLATSQVVTGTYYSLTAGIGGLVALILISFLFAIAILSSVKDEIQKQLQPRQERKS